MIIQIVKTLLLLIFLNSCSLFDKKLNDWGKLELKGKVKSLKEFSYEALEKSGKIIRGKLSRDPYLGPNYYIMFNSEGNKVEEIKYHADSSFDFKINFFYDDNGLLIKKTAGKSNHANKSKSLYTYDENQRLIKSINYRSPNTLISLDEIKYYESKKEHISYTREHKLSTTTTYIYDTRNNLIELITRKADRSILRKIIYFYDENDRKFEQLEFLRSGRLNSRLQFNYDNQSNLIEEISFSKSVIFNDRRTYNFDKLNNVIEYSHFDGDSTLITQSKYIYEYDENENWIKKTYIKNNEPTYILVREIEYFD